MRFDLAAQFQRERLHRAARDRDSAAVERMPAAAYPVTGFDDIGRTPLHDAVEGRHLAVFDRLPPAGVEFNANDERVAGNTPLCEYADSGFNAMARRRIEAGADPTVPGWIWLTALDNYSLADTGNRPGPKVRTVLPTFIRVHLCESAVYFFRLYQSVSG